MISQYVDPLLPSSFWTPSLWVFASPFSPLHSPCDPPVCWPLITFLFSNSFIMSVCLSFSSINSPCDILVCWPLYYLSLNSFIMSVSSPFSPVHSPCDILVCLPPYYLPLFELLHYECLSLLFLLFVLPLFSVILPFFFITFPSQVFPPLSG